MENNTSFQSSWTLAEAIIFEIAGHLRSARNFWLNGNLEKYYWELETVIRVLNGMLDPEERDEAEELEVEIVKLLPPKIQTPDKLKELSKRLKYYDAFVTRVIHTHKLDMPPKRDRTKLIG